MKIGCLGLSANPPHLGHLQMAEEILRLKIVDEIWLIPCFKHSFRKGLPPWEHRWNMTKLMEGDKIKASDMESQRGGISYTIDTVRELKTKFPQYRFYWIVGADIVKNQEYKKWKNWPELVKEIEFLVFPREDFETKEADSPPNFRLLNIKPIVNISSTLIRNRAKRKLSLRGLVTPQVEQYILKNNLYK